jgi:hypothetical protein
MRAVNCPEFEHRWDRCSGKKSSAAGRVRLCAKPIWPMMPKRRRPTVCRPNNCQPLPPALKSI